MAKWHVYIVKCADDTLYTGISTDVDQRIDDHNNSPKAAKYTRARRPVRLVYQASFNSQSEALKEEYRIKKLSRQKKLELIQKY